MKAWAIFLIVILSMGCVVESHGAHGFFIGGAGQIMVVPGNGTWSGMDFKIQEPLSVSENSPIGFSWTDQFILGAKPMMGYRLSDQWALQAGYSFNVPKTSQQSHSQSNSVSYYTQSLQVDWKQSSLELLAFYYSSSDFQYFLFGGLDLVSIDTDVTLYESAGVGDVFGNEIFNGEFQVVSDSIKAQGVVFGAGVEIPTHKDNSEAFIAAQYSLAKTSDTFFGSEDFNVNVGGFTLMIGLKWYPFEKSE